MSVLVKGIKMPKDCPQCLLSSWSPITDEFLGCFAVPGKRYAVLSDKEYAKSTKRPDWCPLVELPEKHGRLIDADELIDYCNDMLRIISESDDDMINIITSRICYANVIGQIINMATILEAEGEE